MAKFKVHFTETESKYFIIEANDAEDAEDYADEMLCGNELMERVYKGKHYEYLIDEAEEIKS